ncbi:MAG: YeeE/YedE family protein [Paracoccaceae bacterium]|jgi:uncharacterized membrane protein YedE/YeeE|nr:YeeE/YedE family protein [Paracoccaceae bacterium]
MFDTATALGLSEPALVALAGLVGGIVLGLAARLGRFCTLGAIEDLLYGGSDIRMRMWALAVGVAVTAVFAMEATGWVATAETFYIADGWNPVAHILGGVLFGYGMALAGNCGYGALARLGGGDLRAFVIVLVMGVSAYVVLSGPLAAARVALLPPDLIRGEMPAGFAALGGGLLGVADHAVGLAAGLAIATAALWPERMRREGRAVLWGAAVGLAIASGWAGTAWIAAHGFEPPALASHSFARPLGDTLLWAMLASGLTLSFGVGSVTGVLGGALIGALISGHFRWEACEDARELRRQIGGAAAMGVGGAVALGCSVGQGLTAFSVLAYGAPLTVACIWAGAWLGLRHLIHGFAPS